MRFKTLFTSILFAVSTLSFAQISVKVCITSVNVQSFDNTKNFNAEINITNPGATINSGVLKLYWPNINSFTTLPWQTNNKYENDTLYLTLSFMGWNTGATKYFIQGNFKSFISEPTFVSFNKNAVPLESCGYVSPNWYHHLAVTKFDTTSFIPSGELKLGQAKLNFQGTRFDFAIPKNRKNWALASALSTAIFNNTVGAKLLNLNYYNAVAIIESKFGCDNGIVNDPNLQSPITYNQATFLNGCFQLEQNLIFSFEQHYNKLYNSNMDFTEVFSGPNVSRAMLSAMFYDLQSMQIAKYQYCFNPMDFYAKVCDEYATEHILRSNFQNGYNDTVFSNRVFKVHRATLENSCKLSESLVSLGLNNPTVWNSHKLHNILVTLNNQISTVGLTTLEQSFNANNYEFTGYYNETISKSDLTAFLNEIAYLYPSILSENIIDKTLAKFDSKSANPIPYMQMGDIIDEIVKMLPLHDPTKGLGNKSVINNAACAKMPIAYFSKITPNKVCEDNVLEVQFAGEGPWTIELQRQSDIITQTYNTNKGLISLNNINSYKINSVSNATQQGVVYSNYNYPAIVKSYVPVVDLGEDINLYEIPQPILDAKNAGAQYLWNTGETTQTIQADNPGEYWVTVTSSKGCEKSDTIFVTFPVSAKDVNGLNVKVYPNPSSGLIYLEHQFNDNIGLEITNSFGQVVLNSTITSPNQSLNLQHLSQGLYHLKLYNQNHQTIKKILIVK